MNSEFKMIKAKALFLQKLANMLDGGIPLVRAVKEILVETNDESTIKAIKYMQNAYEQFDKPFMDRLDSENDDAKKQKIMQELENNYKNFNFSDTLDPNYFSKTEMSMLVTGNKIRRLDRSCSLIVEWLDREAELLTD